MPTKYPNRRATRPRKNDKCAKCGCLCPDRFRLSRVDESNHAITRNALEFCPDCWHNANWKELRHSKYFHDLLWKWHVHKTS